MSLYLSLSKDVQEHNESLDYTGLVNLLIVHTFIARSDVFETKGNQLTINSICCIATVIFS